MKLHTRILIGAGLGLLVIAGLAAWGIPAWRQHVSREQDERLLRAVRRSLDQRRPTEALAIISRRTAPSGESPVTAARWLSLEIEAAAKATAIPRLASLHRRAPEALLAHEEACLALARAYLHAGATHDFEEITARWRPISSNTAWFALDVDRLLLAGDAATAQARLEAARFTGAADIPRLTRLAALAADENLLSAWNHLADAAQLDPRSPDVRLFRGQILERIGKVQLARVEYVAAHLTDANSPWLADQLAEFYRRQGNPASAVEVWGDSLDRSPTDFAALKWAFWSRVTVASTNSPQVHVDGPLAPVADFIRALPPGRFWDGDQARSTPEVERLAVSRQEAYWLRLLEALRVGQEQAALDLMRQNSFRGASWAPHIERALVRLLSLRELQSLNPTDLPSLPPSWAVSEHHAYLAQIEADAETERQGNPIAADRAAFYQQPEALAMVFVAAGWLNAGLDLAPDARAVRLASPVHAYTWAQALRYARGLQPALDFVRAQSPSRELRLLEAELALGLNQAGAARPLLQALLDGEDAIGDRAAWLLAVLAAEQKDWAAADAVLRQRPGFAASTPGIEIASRIALGQNQHAAAEAGYRKIADRSIEARAYLARQAYARSNWAEARRLTTELIELMPDEMALRANLAAIDKAEGPQ